MLLTIDIGNTNVTLGLYRGQDQAVACLPTFSRSGSFG